MRKSDPRKCRCLRRTDPQKSGISLQDGIYLYGNQQDALDVVGTAILKGYQHIRSLKNPQWFRTWITRILIRCAQDANKKIVYFNSIDEVEIPERYEGISLEETWDLRNAIELLPENIGTSSF